MGDDTPSAPIDDSWHFGKTATVTGAAPPHSEPPRRSFFYQALAAAIGGLVGIVPFAAGLAMYFDPLWRKKAGAEMTPVTTLSAVPDAAQEDVLIGRFPVVTDRDDAWTHYPKEPVGSVYLVVPKGTNTVRALQATCPHLGCSVDVGMADGKPIFRCPCHTSAFELDGERIMPCVSPRNMDELPCEIRDVGGRKEVLVKYENFQPGLSEKKVKA